jgi:hypothetical protein
MEWADNMLLVHFEDQGTKIFMWYGGGTYREFTLGFPPHILTHLQLFLLLVAQRIQKIHLSNVSLILWIEAAIDPKSYCARIRPCYSTD